MKGYFLFIFSIMICLTFTSCCEDDGDSEISLTGSGWKLTSLSINGVDQTSTLDECDLLDTYLFTDDGNFTFESNEKTTSGECSKTVLTGTWTEDNSVAGSRRFNATFTGDSESQVLIIEGDVLREDFIEGPDSEGRTETYSFFYSKR